MITKKEKTMKKVIFTACALAIGLWSCSSDNNDTVPSDKYVDVKIGGESGGLIITESGGIKSIVSPGGATSWNMADQVRVLDVDGSAQLFTYAAETPKSSAEFNGRLKGGQGNQVYRAYHSSTKSNMSLKDGHILVVERQDMEITEDGATNNSILFGSYCPMVAIPFEFDVENNKGSKLVQFYHLGTMIEGRVTLRDPQDSEHFDKLFDKIVFEVKAIASKPFYSKIEFDMNKLTTSSTVEHLDDCITNRNDNTVKTGVMTTTMNMQDRTIGDLMNEYKLFGYFAIPIFALSTDDAFDYSASVTFYYKGNPTLKLEGSAEATGLNPAGLNILNFDYKKIVE